MERTWDPHTLTTPGGEGVSISAQVCLQAGPGMLQCAWYNKVSRMPLTLQLVARQEFPHLYTKQDFSHMSTSLRLFFFFIVFQLLNHARLFSTPWTVAGQASLSFTISQSCPNLCALSRWWHPTISSSAAPSYLCLQCCPASESFLISWLFPSHGQSTGASVSASVFPINIHDSFPLGLIGFISLLSKRL